MSVRIQDELDVKLIDRSSYTKNTNKNETSYTGERVTLSNDVLRFILLSHLHDYASKKRISNLYSFTYTDNPIENEYVIIQGIQSFFLNLH
jgi:hypothetical protein